MRKLIKKILLKGGYEIRQVKTMVGRMDVSLMRLRERGLICNSILDIGANQTKWSRLAQQVFPESSFSLIEPQVEMVPHLEKFCSTFKNTNYFLVGAGAKKESKLLTIWDDLQGSSFLPNKNLDLANSDKQRSIDMVTIDGFIESGQLTIPDLIKLDVQGFELEVLKGAEKTFGRTEVYIIEVSLFPFDDLPNMPVFSDVISFMRERNYVVYDFSGFLRRPLDGAVGQCDICFVKKDGFLRKSNKWK